MAEQRGSPLGVYVLRAADGTGGIHQFARRYCGSCRNNSSGPCHRGEAVAAAQRAEREIIVRQPARGDGGDDGGRRHERVPEAGDQLSLTKPALPSPNNRPESVTKHARACRPSTRFPRNEKWLNPARRHFTWKVLFSGGRLCGMLTNAPKPCGPDNLVIIVMHRRRRPSRGVVEAVGESPMPVGVISHASSSCLPRIFRVRRHRPDVAPRRREQAASCAMRLRNRHGKNARRRASAASAPCAPA